MGFWPWKMCQVHSWSWYDLERWPKGQIYRVNDMALCSGLSFFVLWHSHTLFVITNKITSISKLYFHFEFESGKLSLLFNKGIPNFCRIGVSPWDYMLCTVITLVWPWPLTYMWEAGGTCIFIEFYPQLLSCKYFRKHLYHGKNLQNLCKVKTPSKILDWCNNWSFIMISYLFYLRRQRRKQV